MPAGTPRHPAPDAAPHTPPGVRVRSAPTVGRWRSWWLALLAGLVAVALRAVLQPLLGDQLPFIVAYPALTLAALAWGIPHGLVTAGVCAAALALPGLPPDVDGGRLPVQMGFFALAAVVTCLICGTVSRHHPTDGASAAPAAAPRALADTPLTLWLRAVLWGAVLIPLTAFVLAAWWGYDRALREADESVAHASALALRHAERTMVIAQEIAQRADAVAAADDAAVRAGEALVHQRLSDMVAGLPSIVNLNIWDAEGRPLARSDVFPVSARALVSDRAYFVEQRDAGVRSGAAQLGVSEVLRGRSTGRELFNATIRRSAPDGAFRGVIAVSLSPGYFQDYYRSLTADDPRLGSFELLRTDGSLLARWPQAADAATATATATAPMAGASTVLQRVQAGAAAGSAVLAGGASGKGGDDTRLASFRRVPGYPVYVVAAVSRAGVLADWYRFVTLLAASLVPVTVGLVTVSWVALKKTRREQAVSAELQQQIERRATVERAMVESQKLATLAQLTGGVAHDFNNLLAIISNNLHVHRRSHPQLTGERALQAMERAVRAGMRLTRQLLSFSRRQALSPEVIRLQDWLPAAVDLLRTTLNRNIELEIVVADDTHAIRADVAELELALINTALNAQHAMPGGGRLQVTAANAAAPAAASSAAAVTAAAGPAPAPAPPFAPAPAGAPHVVIAVRDTGAGIPADVLPRVFEPFFTTRAAGTGSGLGLTQVSSLCTQAGGVSTIDSQPGRGTSINMFFPAVLDAPPPASTDTPASPARLSGTVLLVEDNADVATATETLLRTAGLLVIRAANAEKALAHITRGGLAPDVVLSDISMPGDMDGIALAFALRERRPGLPVLLTTGYAERLQDALVGGFQVIAKPAPPDQVLAAVAAALATVRSAPVLAAGVAGRSALAPLAQAQEPLQAPSHEQAPAQSAAQSAAQSPERAQATPAKAGERP